MKRAEFFHADRKAKGYFDNYWMGMVKSGQGLIVHGLLNQVLYFADNLVN